MSKNRANTIGHINAGTTKAKPSDVVKALFQTIQHGRLRRMDIEEVLFTVGVAQGKKRGVNKYGRMDFPTCQSGYMTTMILYHMNCGRLERTTLGKKVFYGLTTKGREYAEIRGLLK